MRRKERKTSRQKMKKNIISEGERKKENEKDQAREVKKEK